MLDSEKLIEIYKYTINAGKEIAISEFNAESIKYKKEILELQLRRDSSLTSLMKLNDTLNSKISKLNEDLEKKNKELETAKKDNTEGKKKLETQIAELKNQLKELKEWKDKILEAIKED